MVPLKYECPYLDNVSVETFVLNYGTTNVASTQKDQLLLLLKRRPISKYVSVLE
jgi:hypothetical protein